jgi:formate hydrogenlyase subunit 3/multisubunit Na+/H+ antiporter MnhD subunit
MPDIYNQTDLEDVLLIIFAIIVIIVLFGCLYSFFRAIFFFVFSWWKEEEKKKWRNSIRFMIVWLILCMVFLFSFPYAIKSLNVELEDDYSIKTVFVKSWELFKKMFEIWTFVKDAQKENQFRWQPYYNNNKGAYNL